MAATASAFLGDKVDAAIIGVIVLISIVIDLTQTYRSQRAVEQLRDRVAPTASVLRGGEWKEIRRRDVVPGDIVRLSAGDLVPADARLLIARDLYVQQAALTGESLPAEKEATGEPASTKADARNMVFLGTSVVSGTATAEVVATGARTAFGDIAARLAARPEETAFDKGLRNFSHLLARTVFFLVLFLIVVSIARHRDVASISHVCGRAGRWLDAGIPAHDYVGDPFQRRRRHGAQEGHRQASLRHSEPRQLGCALQR